MRQIILGCAAFMASAGTSIAAPGNMCTMALEDHAWLEGALSAWQQVSTARLKLQPHREPTIIVFDSKCRFERASGTKSWQTTPHSGSITLPDGGEAPAQVASFASSDEKTGVPFFVMALPSIWKAANIPISSDLKGLTGVFLHEFSHTRQVEPLASVFEAAESKRKMPDDFNDDSLQEHFKADPAYAAAIEKERDLLYRAAHAADAVAAKKLAAQVLDLMEARQERWFVGEDAYWKHYDDLFLTMEGFGQWVAFAWLADPDGGGLKRTEAIGKMRGSKRWWSQDVGLGLFLVIDRFVPNWADQAFGSPPKLGIDLLRQAVDEPGK
ncbi:MAG: hypothetical protein ACR2JJ_06210 [Sphingomicrobium sp.]